MIEFLLSLPVLLGVFVAIAVATVLGCGVYLATSKTIFLLRDDAEIEPVANLYRVTALFVSLLLSLSFAGVIGKHGEIETSIDREAVAISDTFHNLRHFDKEATVEIRAMLLDYTQAVIDDDWPALVNDKLSQRTDTLKRQIAERTLSLQPSNPKQEKLWSRILSDITIFSDYRLIRLDKSLAAPPVFIYVVMIGYLISLGFLGIYPAQVRVVVSVSICSVFVGSIIYLVLALSDPFQGAFRSDPAVFEHLLATLQADYP